MTSNEVLSIYENLASLTGQMAMAARANDWDNFGGLESKCERQTSSLKNETVPALGGASRTRKIDLLKMILANDREIRTVTEPWSAQLAGIMQATSTASAVR